MTLITALLLLIGAESRLQFSVPAENLLREFDEDSINDDLSKSTPLEEEATELPIAGQLRKALKAILELNDGELKALLKGVPAESFADRLSPLTAFFLQASKRRLGRLGALAAGEIPLRHRGDLRIARRNKKRRRSMDAKSDEDSDSLLDALARLSEALESRRRKRSHWGSLGSFEGKIHPSYWLKPEGKTNNSSLVSLLIKNLSKF